MTVHPVDKGNLNLEQEGNNKIFNLRHEDLHIELTVISNATARLKQATVQEILNQRCHKRIGQVARLEVDNAIVEIRVKSGHNKKLKQNLISQVEINGVSWDLDVYNSGQASGNTFVQILKGGLRNSFDYNNLYIEFNLSEGQDHISRNYQRPAMENPSILDFQNFVDAIGTMPGIGEVNVINPLGDVIATTKKEGRNNPCSCGSGKKYKKCCGK